MAFMSFGEKVYRELSEKVEALAIRQCALKALMRPRATWLRPQIKVRVRHLKNGTGLRHASVRGLAGQG
jgi:hypothetical protein